MPIEPSPPASPRVPDDNPAERLGSWKAIAAYLQRDVSTVQRWEKREGMPVHRHLHAKLGSVYGFRSELDAWWHDRRLRLEPRRERPVRRRSLAAAGFALLFVIAVVVVASLQRTIGTGPTISSLAVLPLDNLSGDPAQEYLADGMTEALIGRLAQIQTLRVVSRRSVMTFKGNRKPLNEIGQQLGVDALLDGSVQKSGDRVRIALQLIHVGTDTHLWARSYERGVGDTLKLQAELAYAVGEEIRIRLTADERARLASNTEVNPLAHQEYLVGRYHLWRDDEENLKQAITHFERATKIDPGYAPAFAGLSHAWWALGMWGPMSLEAAESPARAAAQQALTLDSRLAEAYVVQADMKRLYDRDLTGAEMMVTRALALDSNNVDAHFTYALTLMALGRFPEAIGQIESAEQLDPLSPAIQSVFGRILYRARRFGDAVPHLHRALELEPGLASVYVRLGDVYDQMGQYDHALAAYQKAAGEGRIYHARLARIYARMGRTADAKQTLRDLETTPGGVPPGYGAAAYAALGDRDRAFALLFAMVDRGGDEPLYLTVDPPFDILHADPRWHELLRRVAAPSKR